MWQNHGHASVSGSQPCHMKQLMNLPSKSGGLESHLSIDLGHCLGLDTTGLIMS